MTLTTKLSALAIAGIMAVIGAPMVTQSAMASGRAPAPDAATTQPKLVTGDITSTDQSGTHLFFGKNIVRNAKGAIMKVDRTWPAAVPAPLPDVRADSSTRMLLGPVVDLAVNEHPAGVFTESQPLRPLRTAICWPPTICVRGAPPMRLTPIPSCSAALATTVGRGVRKPSSMPGPWVAGRWDTPILPISSIQPRATSSIFT